METKFEKSLKEGQKYEKWFAENFLNTNVTFNHNKKFDVRDINGTKYEVKSDNMCWVYFRFGYELDSWGNQAGLMTTDADYWVTIIPIWNRMLIMKVSDMKEFNDRYQHISTQRSTGDNSASTMMLWDWNDYLSNYVKHYSLQSYKLDIPWLGTQESLKYIKSCIPWYIKQTDYKNRCNDQEIFEHYYNILLEGSF